MKFKYCFLLFILLIVGNYAYVNCQVTNTNLKPALQAAYINKPLSLTGKLDNPIWQTAVPVELNYEIQPGDNTPAAYRTLVRAMYDNENLYFGFECFDDKPENIRANITDRDNLSQDDYMVVLIDTYGDYQKSCEFKVNPYGIQSDALSTVNNEDPNVDWVWHSAAGRNEKGWTAEIAIPFSSLSFPDKEEQVWNLGITRIIPRDSRIQISWTKIDRNIPNYYIQLGLLKGMKNIKSGNSIEILPYVIGQRIGNIANMEDPKSGIKFDPIEGRLGGGIKYAPSSNLSVDAVINPDFSQIESDASQISVNTTFALQYEEKRPFFLIGNELLQSNMYYSRSINDPLGAARVLGKSGALSYLYMGAYDRNTVFVIPGEERSNTVGTNLKSFANIGRLRYDFGDESYLGTTILTRNLTDAHNYVSGVDWYYKFWTNWSFEGNFFFSQTKELNDEKILSSTRKFGNTSYNAAFDGEEYSGNGQQLILSHRERSYNFMLYANSYSPAYQSYNGSFSQNAYRMIMMSHEYVSYPENTFIDRAVFTLQSLMRFHYDGVKKEQVVEPRMQLTLKGQMGINASYYVVNDEQFNGTFFNGIHRWHIDFSAEPVNMLSFASCWQFGKFIYRSSMPEMGKGHVINIRTIFKPTSQLNITFSYSRSQLSSEATDKLFYDGNIYRIVGVYQFSSKIFFRTIFEYDTFNKAYQFYPLFSYKLNAFTTFFAGVTSQYQDYDDKSIGIVNTNQQYFLKFQYLIGI